MAGAVTGWLDVPTQVCLSALKTANCIHPHLRCRTQLLKLAVPLVQQHGFTRTALARSVLALPEPHAAPLPESIVTTLFGEGDTARRTLISAWLEEGRTHMCSVPVEDVKGALLARLEYNVPVLEHLPEVPCTNTRLLAGSYSCTGFCTCRVAQTRCASSRSAASDTACCKRC
jgi:hypothetical protein